MQRLGRFSPLQPSLPPAAGNWKPRRRRRRCKWACAPAASRPPRPLVGARESWWGYHPRPSSSSSANSKGSGRVFRGKIRHFSGPGPRHAAHNSQPPESRQLSAYDCLRHRDRHGFLAVLPTQCALLLALTHHLRRDVRPRRRPRAPARHHPQASAFASAPLRRSRPWTPSLRRRKRRL